MSYDTQRLRSWNSSVYVGCGFVASEKATRRHASWLVRRRPSYHHERQQWVLYAFDPSERPIVGSRSREWTARAES